MKLTLKETMVLNEARDPKLKYTEKQAKGAIDRVTVELEKQKSAAMTRMAARYHRLDMAMKRMTEQRDKVNGEMKDTVQGLFNAEDVIYTRVVETSSFVLTLAKQSAKGEDKITYDFQKVAEELAKLIPDELQAKIDEIMETYKKIVPAIVKSPSFTAKPKPGTPFSDKGKLQEGVMDTLKNVVKLIATLTKSITKWAVSYDKKLAALKKIAGM